MQSLHQIPIPPQSDNYSLRINDDLFSSQTTGQAAGGVPQLWQLHWGHSEGHPWGPSQVRAEHNMIILWWPHVMTSCDDLRYRCEGTLVACQYAGAGCTFRGPNKKVREHQAECGFKKEGECGNVSLSFISPRSLKKKMHVQELKPDLQGFKTKRAF